nr:MAG TPA: hypothetical protein [Crassvirales sp.]
MNICKFKQFRSYNKLFCYFFLCDNQSYFHSRYSFFDLTKSFYAYFFMTFIQLSRFKLKQTLCNVIK